MEKGNQVAGGVQTATGANGGAAAAAEGASATSAHPGTGTGTEGEPPETPSTAPSGSIHYPREGDLPKETMSKDADGTWRWRDDETGESWTWDSWTREWIGDSPPPPDAEPPPQA